MERVEQLRGFSKGIWVSIHFSFIRQLMISLPQWVVKIMNESWVNVVHVGFPPPLP